MRRKIIMLLLIIVSVICLAVGISACSNNDDEINSSNGNETDKTYSENGTYYEYTNDSYDYSSYIILKNGEWSDDSGASGTYEVSGTTIVFYTVLFGENEELMDGTVSDGVLTYYIGSYAFTYCKEDKAPSSSNDDDDSTKNEKSLSYKLSDDGSYYIVTGIGDLSGDIQVPETYNDLPVKTIANGAFTQSSNLTSIVISDSVTEIESGAFYNCTTLTSVTIGEGITVLYTETFVKCTALTVIKLPASLTRIENDAFKDGDTVYDYVFTDVYYAGTVAQWCNIDFSCDNGNDNSPISRAENFYIDDELVTEIDIFDITYISAGAFCNYKQLTNVKIGSSVTEIGDYAFSRGGVTSLTLEEGSSEIIGVAAFYSCEITELTIPDSTVTIGANAFAYCKSLNTVLVGEGVTTIEEGAFYGCSSLYLVTLNSALSYIGASAFQLCSSLESISFPSSLLYIGAKAFSSTLTSATFAVTSGWTSGNDEIDGDDLSVPSTAAKLLTTSITKNGYWENAWERTGTQGLIYELSFNGEYYTVTGISEDLESTIKKITIPDTYNGLPVKNIGNNAFNSCTSLTSVTIGKGVTSINYGAFSSCHSFTSITIPDSVTSIGSDAFADCTSLTSIIIPNSVTSIGSDAFAGCTSLTSIIIPNSVTSIGTRAFNSCTSLTRVTIDDSVTSIGGYAFYRCTSLTSITIPDSVTSIGDYAFSGCTSLTSITIPDSGTSIGAHAFENTAYYKESSNWTGEVLYIGSCLIVANNISGSYEIKEGTTLIADNAFRGFTKLESITIPDSVTSIGSSVFWNCTSLTSVVIPDSVTSIGSSAFRNCTSLTSVTIGNGVASIGDCAFCECTALTSITIPDSVTSISGCAFYGCTALTEINFNATAMDNLSSSNNVFYKAGQNGDGITVTIGANVTKIPQCLFCSAGKAPNIINVVFKDDGVCESIGDSAFYGCTSLISITIPNSVTSIGNSAFKGCTSLTSVTIGSGVTSIGSTAFNGCTSLTSVIIPDSVRYIGNYAFNGCTSLTSVTFENTSGWRVSTYITSTSGTSVTVTNASTNATYFTSTYYKYYWRRSES